MQNCKWEVEKYSEAYLLLKSTPLYTREYQTSACNLRRLLHFLSLSVNVVRPWQSECGGFGYLTQTVLSQCLVSSIEAISVTQPVVPDSIRCVWYVSGLRIHVNIGN